MSVAKRNTMIQQKKSLATVQRLMTPLFALFVGVGATACEEKTAAEERAEEASDREELLEKSQEGAADTPEELKEKLGNVPDPQPHPETAEELKEEIGLHGSEEE